MPKPRVVIHDPQVAEGATSLITTTFTDKTETAIPLTDMVTATLVLYDDKTGAFINAHGGTTSTGTATTADPDPATTLLDSAATFQTDGVRVGDIIANTTDGSQGAVTVVVSETELTHAALAGGTDNGWEIGDAYTVGGATNILNANGGVVDANGVLSLTLSEADNVMVDSKRKMEPHAALIEWSYGATEYGKQEIVFYVHNMVKV